MEYSRVLSFNGKLKLLDQKDNQPFNILLVPDQHIFNAFRSIICVGTMNYILPTINCFGKTFEYFSKTSTNICN